MLVYEKGFPLTTIYSSCDFLFFIFFLLTFFYTGLQIKQNVWSPFAHLLSLHITTTYMQVKTYYTTHKIYIQ